MCDLQNLVTPKCARQAHPRTDDMGAQDTSKRACVVGPTATVNGNSFPASPRRSNLQPPHGVGAAQNAQLGRAWHAGRAGCGGRKGRERVCNHHFSTDLPAATGRS